MVSWRILTADLYPEKSSPVPVSLFPILEYFNFSLVVLLPILDVNCLVAPLFPIRVNLNSSTTSPLFPIKPQFITSCLRSSKLSSVSSTMSPLLFTIRVYCIFSSPSILSAALLPILV